MAFTSFRPGWSWVPYCYFSELQMKTTSALVFSVGILAAFLYRIISDRLIKIKGVAFTGKSVAKVSFMCMVAAIFLSTYTRKYVPVTISLFIADF
jgi:hypothetical protein